MKYLDPSALKATVNAGRVLEQYLGAVEIDSIAGFKWISLELQKGTYYLLLHEVMDDRPELESIYEFSYFEPDDLYGKEIIASEDFEVVLKIADELGAKRHNYLPYGSLDEIEWGCSFKS